ncbi:MAG: LysM peptidoglycan-binding domain-containing protein [Anaerolineae bacterium]|nr:LysM peptidoglycan-binding domain-containing protein [Anaerolineae bacterium]
MRHWALGLALAGLLTVTLACNLSRELPTASPEPSTATFAGATQDPNFIPSVTPIGAATATPLPGTPTVCAAPLDWFPYVVQPGDTLTDIAARTSSTVQELVIRNCLASPDAIFVGQTLFVPVQLPPSG